MRKGNRRIGSEESYATGNIVLLKKYAFKTEA